MCTKFDHRLDQSRIGDRRKRNSPVKRSIAIGLRCHLKQPDGAPATWCIGLRYYVNNQPPAGWGAAMLPGDRVPEMDSSLPCAEYRVRPVQCVSFMDLSENSSLGPLGSDHEILRAGSHPTPEGWVRPQGVGSRAPHPLCGWKGEDLASPSADPFLIQHPDMPETE